MRIWVRIRNQIRAKVAQIRVQSPYPANNGLDPDFFFFLFDFSFSFDAFDH